MDGVHTQRTKFKDSCVSSARAIRPGFDCPQNRTTRAPAWVTGRVVRMRGACMEVRMKREEPVWGARGHGEAWGEGDAGVGPITDMLQSLWAI